MIPARQGDSVRLISRRVRHCCINIGITLSRRSATCDVHAQIRHDFFARTQQLLPYLLFDYYIYLMPRRLVVSANYTDIVFKMYLEGKTLSILDSLRHILSAAKANLFQTIFWLCGHALANWHIMYGVGVCLYILICRGLFILLIY